MKGKYSIHRLGRKPDPCIFLFLRIVNITFVHPADVPVTKLGE